MLHAILHNEILYGRIASSSKLVDVNWCDFHEEWYILEMLDYPNGKWYT